MVESYCDFALKVHVHERHTLPERLQGAYIFISKQSDLSDKVECGRLPTDLGTSPPVPVVTLCQPKIIGRHVQLTKKGFGFLDISEVDIYVKDAGKSHTHCTRTQVTIATLLNCRVHKVR